MFDINSKKVNYDKDNFVIQKNLSLDNELDCFFVVSSDNKNFGELLSNNIVEYIIDRISIGNTYNDFSTSLENINGFIKTWKQDTNKEVQLDVFIGILNKNSFIFSNTGASSCYLLNSESELIEITDSSEVKSSFGFISNGELKNNDTLIFSNIRILDYLSQSDVLDGITHDQNIKVFNENLKNILEGEILDQNIFVSSLKYTTFVLEAKQNPHIALLQEKVMDIADNKHIKKVLAHGLILKDKCKIESKNFTNGLFLVGITASLFILYSVLSGVITMSTQNENKELAKNNIVAAKNFLRIASENINNTNAFELNIDEAKKMIQDIEGEQLFLNDVSKLNDDINVLKKQFNKIETFKSGEENGLYTGDLTQAVKIIKNNFKPYVINKTSIIGPILANGTPKTYSFNSLEENEEFIDAAAIGDNLYLLTSSSKIVKFSKNGHFNFMDVAGQQTWQASSEINSYAQNIYLLGKEDSQLYKHTLSGKSFSKATPYLNSQDLEQIGNVVSTGIDGGFYILKEDLSLVKFFSSPKYRLENIVLNKLPKNYNIQKDSRVEIKTRGELSYVYMLLDNKIWIFQPNTKRFQDTKSLTYIGQIEGEKEDILDFNIENDRILTVLNSKGLYKLEFEISDDKLLIR